MRNYVLRGLLRPARRTDSGYGLYDAQALERLRFVRAAFEAGIGLDELARLCHALDSGTGDADECLARLRALIAARREALAVVDQQLEKMASAAYPHAQAESHHA